MKKMPFDELREAFKKTLENNHESREYLEGLLNNGVKSIDDKLSERIKREAEAHSRRLGAESELGELSIAVCELLQFIDYDGENPDYKTLINRCRVAMRSHCEVCGGCE